MTISIDEANAYLLDSIMWGGLTANVKATFIGMSTEILNNQYLLTETQAHKMAIARYALFLAGSSEEPGMTKSTSIGGASVTYDFNTGDLPMVVKALLTGAKKLEPAISSPEWSYS